MPNLTICPVNLFFFFFVSCLQKCHAIRVLYLEIYPSKSSAPLRALSSSSNANARNDPTRSRDPVEPFVLSSHRNLKPDTSGFWRAWVESQHKPFNEARGRLPLPHAGLMAYANSPGYRQCVLGVIPDGWCHKHSRREILLFSIIRPQRILMGRRSDILLVSRKWRRRWRHSS
jgi:hypothetical protein